MANDSPVPVVSDNYEEDAGYNPEKIDKRTAESEDTGRVPKSEVADLKDSLGGGKMLDHKSGIETRGVKNDAMKQEREVDSMDLGDSGKDVSKSSIAQ